MFEPLQQFIPKTAQTHGIKKELTAAHICQIFRRIAPEILTQLPEAQSHITPAHYQDGILTINTTSPAWSQEVVMRKTRIIEEMNSAAGQQIIKNLKTQLLSP